MSHVARLETLADLRRDANARRVSVSATLYAVLDDGRRVLLLGNRGWIGELRGAGTDEVVDIWARESERDIAQTARVVVDPDEPFDGRSRDDMEADHWNALAATLRGYGVVVSADQLTQLLHDVVLSEPLRARLGRGFDET